jgi:hypothetical protein
MSAAVATATAAYGHRLQTRQDFSGLVGCFQCKDDATKRYGGKNEVKAVINFSSTGETYSYYNPVYQQYILCRGGLTNQKSKIQ